MTGNLALRGNPLMDGALVFGAADRRQADARYALWRLAEELDGVEQSLLALGVAPAAAAEIGRHARVLRQDIARARSAVEGLGVR